MSDPVYISPSRLAVYATCPRQYEYDYVWDVETPEESRRYLDRGLAYHDAIEEICATVGEAPASFSDGEIQSLARDVIEDHWAAQTDRAEYTSDAQYRYDRALAVSAVESYFAGPGIEHARNSLAQEAWIECERNGVHIRGRADHIVEADDGLQIIDYKGTLNGIVSSYTAAYIAAHHEGEEYHADILSSVFQAAAYIEGVRESRWYDPGMDVEFTYYGLMADKERTPGVDGIQVSVSGRGRDVAEIYESHEETIWELMEECYRSIVAGDHTPHRREQIYENACADCAYQAMCGEYIAEEVRIDE